MEQGIAQNPPQAATAPWREGAPVIEEAVLFAEGAEPAIGAEAPEASAETIADAAAVESYNEPLPEAGDDDGLLAQFRRLRGPSDSLRGGDREGLRDHLVLVHAPLVDHCARGFSSSGEPLEDLVQEGTIGLIKAVDRFDPEKGVRFSTYACHLIAGEMRHYLRDLGKLIHEPGWHAQLRGQVTRLTEELTQKLGRAPRPEEVATALNIQPHIVNKVLDSSQTLSVASLDAENEESSHENVQTPLYDEGTYNAQPLATRVENRVMLAHAIPQLRDLEQRAVRMFYFDELTKTEIARRLGISVNYAAYLVKRGVEHLRQIIETDPQMTPVSARVVSRVLAVATGELAEDRPMPFAQLPLWIEEALRTPSGRARRTPGEGGGPASKCSLALLQIRNWAAATAQLGAEGREEARLAAQALAGRCCRKDDRIIETELDNLPGLHFLALLPNTSEPGRRVGERWIRTCDARAIYPRNPTAVDALLTDFVFISAPQDGNDAETLLATLEARIVGA